MIKIFLYCWYFVAFSISESENCSYEKKGIEDIKKQHNTYYVVNTQYTNKKCLEKSLSSRFSFHWQLQFLHIRIIRFCTQCCIKTVLHFRSKS